MESESQKAQNLYRIETEKSINLKELDRRKRNQTSRGKFKTGDSR